MTHSHRKVKSRFEYFRMDVPERHRVRVGKTSWQHSLQTTDSQIAAIKRAGWTAHYKTEVKRLDDQLAQNVIVEAAATVDAAIEQMTIRNGSLDAVMVGLLMLMALHVRCSWGVAHAQAVERHFGITEITENEDELPLHVPIFVTDAERDRFVLQATMFERRGMTQGLIHQQLAVRLLAQEGWVHVEDLLLTVSNYADEDFQVGSARYNAVARHFLWRLAEHKFGHWPKDLMGALAPLGATPEEVSRAPALIAPPPARLIGSGHPISGVFGKWRSISNAREKTKDEFASAIKQFIDLFGDMPVGLITKTVVKDFRAALLTRPARPAPDIRKLSLREQIAVAAERGLATVSPKSAKKALQGLKSVLVYAVAEELIEVDPSVNITIDTNDGYEDDRLPFNGDQMRLIYRQPTLVDPDVGDNTLFWFFVLAPFTGCRGEELAQLRPGNIRCESGIWFIAIERDLKAKRQTIAEEGGIQKRAKTKTSLRKIPVHPALVKAGFLEFVEHQKVRQAEWLFNNMSANAKYGTRYPALSQRLNRRLRSFGITDSEYVFYSFRHTLKRCLREDPLVKEEISDLLTGHSFPVSVGRKYGSGAGLKTLSEAIERVAFPEMDWGPVAFCGLERVARLRLLQ